MSSETKLLPNISTAGLKALAGAMLAPQAQSRLDELLQGISEGELSEVEMKEVDAILKETDELNLIKARAEYTLRHQSERGTS